MIKKSSKHNPNYLAKVVEIKNVRNHPNADRLQLTTIDGNTVVLGIDTEIGDVGIYFPVECEINGDFLSANNLYRHSERNSDKEKKGLFEDTGRVKAVRLRGEKSMGFWIPVESLECFVDRYSIATLKQGNTIGEEFDTIMQPGIGGDNILLCKKYVVRRTEGSGSRIKEGKKPKVSKILDGQFRFHIDTAHLGKNMWRIHPDSVIQITKKLHGTSGISARVICKRKLSLFEKVKNMLGLRVKKYDYDYVYSSRKVIKNDDLNKKYNHYYNFDIWGQADKMVRLHLTAGMTVYYEIVGYLPDGGHIQKNYDYGCDVGRFQIYVYRATYTTPMGFVHEFGSQQLKEWCDRNSLLIVPELFYGKARDLLNMDVDIDRWRSELLSHLQDNYLEKQCDMCKNSVPDEGIVLRIEGLDIDTYKLKSFAFMEYESKELDKGEENIEDTQ